MPGSQKGQQHCDDLHVLINIFYIARMSWRWRGVEGDETGTRGGAGAAAGQPENNIKKVLQTVPNTFFKKH